MTGDQGACQTPMSDHVARFWELLKTEHVRILIDMRRDTSSVPYWDSASFGDDIAKALVADRHTMTREQAKCIVFDFEQAVIDHERETVARNYTRDVVKAQRERVIAALAAGDVPT